MSGNTTLIQNPQYKLADLPKEIQDLHHHLANSQLETPRESLSVLKLDNVKLLTQQNSQRS